MLFPNQLLCNSAIFTSKIGLLCAADAILMQSMTALTRAHFRNSLFFLNTYFVVKTNYEKSQIFFQKNSILKNLKFLEYFLIFNKIDVFQS